MQDHKQTSDIFKSLGGLRLWEARHSMVLNFIQQKHIETMMDLGCSEATLIQKVQRGTQLRLIIGLDIDEEILRTAIQNVKPEDRQFDLQFQRDFDQHVKLYRGNALEKYFELKKFKLNLVTLVEVIEHIEEKHLEELNENVFGFLRPQYVFVSTPNSQFNSLFNWESGRKFRHDDHKFEWTREQFQNYVQNICSKFNYQATLTGVGESAMQEHWNKGYCTQIAIFQRLNDERLEPSKDLMTLLQLKKETTQMLPAVPLVIKQEHINYSWSSIKDDLIRTAFDELAYKCELNNGFLSWMRVVEELKKKPIFRKFIELDSKWSFNYFLKSFIENRLTHSQIMMCSEQGVQLKGQIDEYFQQSTPTKRAQEEFQKQILRQFEAKQVPLQMQMQKQQKLNDQSLPLQIYKYDNTELFQYERKRRNRRIQKKQHSSSESSAESQSCSESESNKSDSSWGSVEYSSSQIKKRVPRRKIRGFKKRKQLIKQE